VAVIKKWNALKERWRRREAPHHVHPQADPADGGVEAKVPIGREKRGVEKGKGLS
jgi:hypothetical protein